MRRSYREVKTLPACQGIWARCPGRAFTVALRFLIRTSSRCHPSFATPGGAQLTREIPTNGRKAPTTRAARGLN